MSIYLVENVSLLYQPDFGNQQRDRNVEIEIDENVVKRSHSVIQDVKILMKILRKIKTLTPCITKDSV